MDESAEPLLDNNENRNNKSERKKKGKISETLKTTKPFAFNINNLKIKDSKEKKIKNRFIFKVYLHFLIHILFIILINILSFKIQQFHAIISKKTFLFYTFLILTFILLIYPLFNDYLLKHSPYNYFYLMIFTISLSYIISKIFISFKSASKYKIIKVSSILFIFQLIFLIINEYLYKKKALDVKKINIILGLCLILTGLILYFLEKISFLKLVFIIIFILLLSNYLIYDTDLILNEKRRKFKERDYVLATVYLYIDIIQTILELIQKFYNLNEPESRPVKCKGTAISMIYTGEEAYDQLYCQKEQDDKEEDYIIRRTNSAKRLKIDNNKIIKECENENDDEESENKNKNIKKYKKIYSNKVLLYKDYDE